MKIVTQKHSSKMYNVNWFSFMTILNSSRSESVEFGGK